MENGSENQLNKNEKQVNKNKVNKNKVIKKIQVNENQENRKLQERELRLPETVKIGGVLTPGDDSSQEQTVIWVTKQGYMKQTLIRLEDDAGKNLNIQFFPFIDVVALTD
jgi:hypothetical protein